MRCMIIVNAPRAGSRTAPISAAAELLAETADYHEQPMKAGALPGGPGPEPGSGGWRIRYDRDARSVMAPDAYTIAKERDL